MPPKIVDMTEIKKFVEFIPIENTESRIKPSKNKNKQLFNIVFTTT